MQNVMHWCGETAYTCGDRMARSGPVSHEVSAWALRGYLACGCHFLRLQRMRDFLGGVNKTMGKRQRRAEPWCQLAAKENQTDQTFATKSIFFFVALFHALFWGSPKRTCFTEQSAAPCVDTLCFFPAESYTEALEEKGRLALAFNEWGEGRRVSVRLAVGRSTCIAGTWPDMVRCQPWNMFRVKRVRQQSSVRCTVSRAFPRVWLPDFCLFVLFLRIVALVQWCKTFYVPVFIFKMFFFFCYSMFEPPCALFTVPHLVLFLRYFRWQDFEISEVRSKIFRDKQRVNASNL